MSHPGAAWPALAAREAGLDLLNLGFSRAPPVVSFLLRAVGRGTRSREALVGGIHSDDDGQGAMGAAAARELTRILAR